MLKMGNTQRYNEENDLQIGKGDIINNKSPVRINCEYNNFRKNPSGNFSDVIVGSGGT